MKELIKIEERDGKQVVSAKELYNKLGFDKTHWKRWYKNNIIENKFALENEDYCQLAPKARTKDFALTIDFAKKLSMMASTEKGNEVRDYFIEIEKKLKHDIHYVPLEFIEKRFNKIEKKINMLINEEKEECLTQILQLKLTREAKRHR